MLQQILDLVLGFVARVVLGSSARPASSIDIEGVVELFSERGEHLLARAQKLLLVLLAAAGCTALAVTVLTVRIFQLSAGTTVSILGVAVDGAILFGLILCAAASALSYSLLRDRAEERPERVERARPQPSPPPPPSPIELAVAAWIHSQIEQSEIEKKKAAEKEGRTIAAMNDGWQVSPEAPQA